MSENDLGKHQQVCDRPDACRITEGYRTTTCIGWTPVYDGHGNQLNTDPNITRWSEHCSTCGRTWDMTRTHGATASVERLKVS
jgi:hypothetical protein